MDAGTPFEKRCKTRNGAGVLTATSGDEEAILTNVESSSGLG